jgi:hypothetical protein
MGRLRDLSPILLLAALAACGREPAAQPDRPAPLDTVDVGAAPDAAASTASDPVERRREAPGGIAGRLPEGFPRELPLPNPAGLVDFGPGGAGEGPWIELVAARAATEVEAAYRKELAGAGFAAEPGGVFVRGPLRVSVAIAPRGAGASIRIATLR